MRAHVHTRHLQWMDLVPTYEAASRNGKSKSGLNPYPLQDSAHSCARVAESADTTARGNAPSVPARPFPASQEVQHQPTPWYDVTRTAESSSATSSSPHENAFDAAPASPHHRSYPVQFEQHAARRQWDANNPPGTSRNAATFPARPAGRLTTHPTAYSPPEYR